MTQNFYDDVDFGGDVCELCLGTGEIEAEDTLDGRPRTCPECSGTGDFHSGGFECGECGGSGLSNDTSDYRCPSCGGTG